MGGDFERQRRIPVCGVAGNAVRTHERVVLRAEDERRHAHMVEQVAAAHEPVEVLHAPEAEVLHGVARVVVLEGADRVEALVADQSRARRHLPLDARAERLEELFHVEASEFAVERLRTSGHIDRGGHRDGAPDVARVRSAQPEVVQREVPTEAEPKQCDVGVAGALRVAHDRVEVAREPAVVEVRLAVRLAAATPVVPDEDIEARLTDCVDGAPDVLRLRVALHAVGQDDEAGRPAARPVEVQEVPVRRLDPLSLVLDGRRLAKESGVQGLDVPVAKE